jgi:Tat protein secretion system quality control protein TatD with DNase activity
MIHIETDSPYVSTHRGERNEPTYVVEVLKKIEEIRGEKVKEKLLENANRFFNLSA